MSHSLFFFLGHDGLPEGEEHQAVYPQSEELGLCKGLLCASFSVLSPQALSPELQPFVTVLGWVACQSHTPSLRMPMGAALLAPTCPGLHPHLPAVQCTQILPNPKGSFPLPNTPLSSRTC